MAFNVVKKFLFLFFFSQCVEVLVTVNGNNILYNTFSTIKYKIW